MRLIKTSLVAVCFLVTCTNKIIANVQVDEKAFPIQSCRAGEASSFNGIDFLSFDGTKLRLVYEPTKQAHVFLFPQDNKIGVDLGMCGPMSIERQKSRINNIANQQGHATLNCTSTSHHVVGEVSFENCH